MTRSHRLISIPAAVGVALALAAVAPAAASATDRCVQNGPAASVPCPGSFGVNVYNFVADAFAAVQNGDTIQIEPGTYTEAVNFPAKTNVAIFGAPGQPRPVLTSANTGQTFEVTNGADGLVLRHLEIDSTYNGGASTLANAFHSNGGGSLTADDIVVNTATGCAQFSGTSVVVTNVTAQQTGGTDANCISIGGQSGATVKDVSVNAPGSDFGLAISSDGPVNADRLNVVGGAGTSGVLFPVAIVVAGESSQACCATLNHVRASGSPVGIAVAGVNATVLNSIAQASGPPAAVFGGPYGLFSVNQGHLTARNVTALATGSGSIGAAAEGSLGDTANSPSSLTASNSILRGQSFDAAGLPPLLCTMACVPANGSASLDHTNYRHVAADGTTPGVGIQSADPLFAGPTDFHLRKGSPAIDAGVAVPTGDTDLDGIVRPKGTAPDLGAYESPYTKCTKAKKKKKHGKRHSATAAKKHKKHKTTCKKPKKKKHKK